MTTDIMETGSEFYEKIYKQIGAYVRKLTSDSEYIDEVTQEVFLKIHRSIGTLKNDEKLTSWLNRIVYTTLIDHYNKRKKTPVSEAVLFEALPDDKNEDNVALMACIMELLEFLPIEQRELLKAVEIDGLKQTDYAKQHNIKLSTVKSRVQRAKQKIKEQILSGCYLRTDKFGNVVDYQPPKK